VSAGLAWRLAVHARLQSVARAADAEMIGAGAFSATVVLAQLRSTAADLRQATGMVRGAALAALPLRL
jgi:hypothetical protein